MTNKAWRLMKRSDIVNIFGYLGNTVSVDGGPMQQ